MSPADVLSDFETVLLMRNASAVKRYHTQRTLREQTLGAHSYEVSMLVNFIHPGCRKEVLLAAMYHDLPEFITGDLPAPVKRNSPQLKELLDLLEQGCSPLYQDWGITPEEDTLLKFCDTLELVLWCLEEEMMGNRNLRSACIRNGLRWLHDMKLASWPLGPYSWGSRAKGILMEATNNAKVLGITLD